VKRGKGRRESEWRVQRMLHLCCGRVNIDYILYGHGTLSKETPLMSVFSVKRRIPPCMRATHNIIQASTTTDAIETQHNRRAFLKLFVAGPRVGFWWAARIVRSHIDSKKFMFFEHFHPVNVKPLRVVLDFRGRIRVAVPKRLRTTVTGGNVWNR